MRSVNKTELPFVTHAVHISNDLLCFRFWSSISSFSHHSSTSPNTFFFNCLALDDGTDRRSQNAGNQLQKRVTSQKSEGLHHIATEACNLSSSYNTTAFGSYLQNPRHNEFMELANITEARTFVTQSRVGMTV